MAEYAKCTLTKKDKSANVISRGLPELQRLLSEQNVEVDGFDDLYTAAVSIVSFVAAKERKTIREKLNLEENK